METQRDPIDNISELFGLTREAAREVLERTKAKTLKYRGTLTYNGVEISDGCEIDVVTTNSVQATG